MYGATSSEGFLVLILQVTSDVAGDLIIHGINVSELHKVGTVALDGS